MFKSFKQKTFNLLEHTLKNTKFEDKIPHYETTVTKKLKISEINNETVSKLISIKDIELKDNYSFVKKIHPENLKLINHILFDYHTKSSKPKIILVRNKDDKYNRLAMQRVEERAMKNQNIDFFHMYNTEKNLEFLNKKFTEGEFTEIKNYPQLLILKEGKLKVLSDKLFLKYSISTQDLNTEISKSLI